MVSWKMGWIRPKVALLWLRVVFVFGCDAFPQYGDGFLGALCQLARAYKCANGKLLGVVRRHAHLYCGFLHCFDKVENIGWARARNRRDCIQLRLFADPQKLPRACDQPFDPGFVVA